MKNIKILKKKKLSKTNFKHILYTLPNSCHNMLQLQGNQISPFSRDSPCFCCSVSDRSCSVMILACVLLSWFCVNGLLFWNVSPQCFCSNCSCVPSCLPLFLPSLLPQSVVIVIHQLHPLADLRIFYSSLFGYFLCCCCSLGFLVFAHCVSSVCFPLVINLLHLDLSHDAFFLSIRDMNEASSAK